MIRSIVTLIWNQRRKNAFIVIEMFLLFFLLFFSGFFFLEKLTDYWYPENYSLENRIYLSMNTDNGNPKEHLKKQSDLLERLSMVSGVLKVSTVFHSPLSYSSSYSSVGVGKKKIQALYRGGDENLKDLLGFKLISGRWYSKEEVNNYAATYPFDDDTLLVKLDKSQDDFVLDIVSMPIVIDRLMAEKIGVANTLGTTVIANHRKCVVVGVVEPVKTSPFEKVEACIFFPVQFLSAGESGIEYCLLTDGSGNSSVFQDISLAINSVFEKSQVRTNVLTSMVSLRANIVARDRVDLVLLSFLTLFVLFTALLGLVGILTYSINKRKAEIGILRAVGSTKAALRWRLVLEMVFVSLMGVIPAAILLAQIPLLGTFPIEPMFFYSSLAFIFFFIIVLVVVFVWYPAVMASRIEPARALKDE